MGETIATQNGRLPTLSPWLFESLIQPWSSAWRVAGKSAWPKILITWALPRNIRKPMELVKVQVRVPFIKMDATIQHIKGNARDP